jgi:predicted DNA-binding protein YlxM (UPF0122 family)
MKRKTISQETKRAVVKDFLTGEYTQVTLAKKHSVSEGSISKIIKAYKESPEQTLENILDNCEQTFDNTFEIADKKTANNNNMFKDCNSLFEIADKKTATEPTIQDKIIKKCDAIKELLLSKNKQYGNSALDPIRIFSNSNTVEQLKVRIDDKLSRIKRGNNDTEDTITDLIGYFILLQIAEEE